MALYALPKTLSAVYNKESFVEANAFNSLGVLTTPQIQTTNQNVTQSLNIISGTDTLTLSDTQFIQHHNDLNISTDDGFTLHVNNNKPTSGDLNINENSKKSNVNIVNGNLNIQNGYLNLGKNGTIILNGADINAIMTGNSYQLSVHQDTLANQSTTIATHAVNIQASVDTGVVNTNQIVSIQSNYAPLDQPIFSTNMTCPPIVIANGANVSDTQISFLRNLNGDVQTALDSLNTSVNSISNKQIQDESNIASLQTNVSTISSKQTQDESNIVSLQSSVSTIASKQTTDENNIAALQSNVSTISSKQIQDEGNIAFLQSSVSTIASKQTTDETNIAALQSSVASISSKQLLDESNITALRTSLTTDESNITAIQTSLATITSKQVTDESNISALQTLVDTKANLNSPTFTGIARVATASPQTNSTQIANTSYVDTAIATLVGTAPSLLNTLQEIDAAINNDPSFSTTIGNQISLKANINNPTFTTGIATPAINLNGTDLQTSLDTFQN